MPELKTILLIDPLSGGHHLGLLEKYASLLLKEGYTVVVFCPDHRRLNGSFDKRTQNIYILPFSRFLLFLNDGILNYVKKSGLAFLQIIAGFVHFITATIELIASIFYKIKGISEFLSVVFYSVDKFFEKMGVLFERGVLVVQIFNLWVQSANAVNQSSKITGKAPDLVFFCWLDSYIYISKWLTNFVEKIFPYKWSGLYFHPDKRDYEYYLDDTMLGSPSCKQIAFLNEYACDDLVNVFGREKVIKFPDVNNKAESDKLFDKLAEIKQLAGNRKIIGLAGSLEARKGFMTLLRVAITSQNAPLFFVFAGKIAPTTFQIREWMLLRKTVKSKYKNIYFYLNEIEDESQFNALIEGFDIVFAAYLDFKGSSNLLTKAAFYNKPVIASKGYCMGKRVAKYKTGLVIEQDNVDQCKRAINQILESKDIIDYSKNSNIFYAVHSNESLRTQWIKLINKSINTK